MKKREITIMLLALIAILAVTITMLIVGIAKADTRFVCAVTKGEWVWMRADPDKDAEKIDTIRFGVEGEIHEIQNGYARITTIDGREGWADVSYLLMPIREEVWTVITEGPVNRRETPGGRYLGRVRGGVRISVLGWRYDKNGELWAHVYHGGYIKAVYLARETETSRGGGQE